MAGLVYLVMKHLVDRHNLYFVAKPVRLGGQMHARAVTFINTGVILLQVWMIMFTAIRSGQSNGDIMNHSKFLFYIYMYTICKCTQRSTESNLWHLPWKPHMCTLYQIMYVLTSFREWSVPDSGSPVTI